jgi:hypothetical protein
LILDFIDQERSRGLTLNHNYDLRDVFKSAATTTSAL